MSENSKAIPRYLLTCNQVILSFASRRTLVDALREEKILVGKRFKNSLVFSAKHVEEIADRWMAGEYDQQLEGKNLKEEVNS